MRRIVVSLMLTLIGLMVFASTAIAASPCNDTNDDGLSSGMEYAHYHIAELAKVGGLGNDGHKPGSHHGFSVCNPSGK